MTKQLYIKVFILTLNLILLMFSTLFSKSQTQSTLQFDTQSEQSSTMNITTTFPTPFQASQLHYSRVPYQYWQHRIKALKSLGFDTLCVPVIWNYHQVRKEKFDFFSENKNLEVFLKLVERNGMNVILKPGPYVGAGWDFGGLPARLIGEDGIKIRANDQYFLDQVKIYFTSLAPIIRRHLKTPNNPYGSIFLLQIQHQYGSFGNDPTYLEALIKIWKKLDINCQFFYEETIQHLKSSHWQGANIGIINAREEDYLQATYQQLNSKVGYVFGTGIKTGAIYDWGKDGSVGKVVEKYDNQFNFYLEGTGQQISFCVQLGHGGTSFGLTAGATRKDGKYYPHITSFNHDAPVNQQGLLTTQNHAVLLSLLKKRSTQYFPYPEKIPRFSIPEFILIPKARLLTNLPAPRLQDYIIINSSLPCFESVQLGMYHQGIVVYQTSIQKGKVYKVRCEIRDFGLIVVDGKVDKIIDRMEEQFAQFQIGCGSGYIGKVSYCHLRVIVEAMGHIDNGEQMINDKKGLLTFQINSTETLKWNIYTIPLNWTQKSNTPSQSLLQALNWKQQVYIPSDKHLRTPTILESYIQVQKPADIFLEIINLKKGYVYINGKNLGRYWEKGPQNRLYCPGVWLKEGKNLVEVLEIAYDGYGRKSIRGMEVYE